jgi:hypothetical protein
MKRLIAVLLSLFALGALCGVLPALAALRRRDGSAQTAV